MTCFRWNEAYKVRKAPPVYLKHTKDDVLKYTRLEDLKKMALDL